MQTTARPTLDGTGHGGMRRTQSDGDKKECIKFNSIVSLEKDNLLASCHPPNVLCGIMIVTNQKNKACIIAFCNAHRYKYKIHVRRFCTFHIYMAHV